MREAGSKFKAAVESIPDRSFEVRAPEMDKPNFADIRQKLITDYSHPAHISTPAELLEQGFAEAPGMTPDEIIYQNETYSIIFNH